MNKAKYDAMSPAQKKVIDEHCTTEWAVKVASPWADFEKAGRDQDAGAARPRGLSADARAAEGVEGAAAPLQKQWADAVTKAGGNPDQVLQGARRTASPRTAPACDGAAPAAGAP